MSQNWQNQRQYYISRTLVKTAVKREVTHANETAENRRENTSCGGTKSSSKGEGEVLREQKMHLTHKSRKDHPPLVAWLRSYFASLAKCVIPPRTLPLSPVTSAIVKGKRTAPTLTPFASLNTTGRAWSESTCLQRSAGYKEVSH